MENGDNAHAVSLPPSPHLTVYNLPGAEVGILIRLHCRKGSTEDVVSSPFKDQPATGAALTVFTQLSLSFSCTLQQLSGFGQKKATTDSYDC